LRSSTISPLTPAAVASRQFTHVDYTNHVALVAELFTEDCEIVIAEARYVRRIDPSLAEVSVSVAERWQGKGLAKLMLSSSNVALPPPASAG
jgi:hypothetical protein